MNTKARGVPSVPSREEVEAVIRRGSEGFNYHENIDRFLKMLDALSSDHARLSEENERLRKDLAIQVGKTDLLLESEDRLSAEVERQTASNLIVNAELQHLYDTIATLRSTLVQREKDAERWCELIYAVEKKFPNESRHETALRYIRERETPNNDQRGAQCAGSQSSGQEK